MKISKFNLSLLLFFVVLSFECTAVTSTLDVDKSGFFSGLWHGFFIPFRFIASFFMDVDVIADVNTGIGYFSGLFIGVLLFVAGFSSSIDRSNNDRGGSNDYDNNSDGDSSGSDDDSCGSDAGRGTFGQWR